MITTTLSVDNVYSEHDVVQAIDVQSLGLTEVQKEYRTKLGYVDIMTFDEDGRYVPIEVKFGEASDSAVGQILGYMKASGAEKGIIIASCFSKRVEAVCGDMDVTLIAYTCNENMQVTDNTIIDTSSYYAQNQCSYAHRSWTDRMRVHADIDAHGKDAVTTDGATFADLDDVCIYIEEVERFSKNRAYTALCGIGKEYCNQEFRRNGNNDMFSDIDGLIRTGRKSVDGRTKRLAAKHVAVIFDEVRSKKFKTSRHSLAIDVEYCKNIGIKPSHMNLYYTLTGLKCLVENEEHYIALADKDMFIDALRPLIRADRTLDEWRRMLQISMSVQ